MRPFYQMWIFVGCVGLSSVLPFAACIGDSSTGALSQSLTDDGGTDGGADMSTPAADMAVAVPDLALPPIPPGARIRPRIPVVGSVAINAPMGLWDSKINAPCQPGLTIDGRTRCIPKPIFPLRVFGQVYYYDRNCTKPFALVPKYSFQYPTCVESSQIGAWDIRIKPYRGGVHACDDQEYRPVMFASVITGEETIPLAPASAIYYKWASIWPLGLCGPSGLRDSDVADSVVYRMAGYDVSELAEMSELH